MKTLVTITLTLVIGFVFSSTAFAMDKSECIYSSKINQMISFYQGRLYLTDSEFKILSDVGQDAQKMVNYLKANKDLLVREMLEKGLGFQSDKMRAFVVNRARFASTGIEYIGYLTH